MKHSKSFTLIEVIVVIGTIIIVLPALFSIIFSLLRQQVKIYQLSEIKRQGDYALSIIESTIRMSAISIYDQPVAGVETCATAGAVDQTVNYFRDESNNWFRYVLTSNKISSESSIPNASSDLTTSRVTISNLVVRCSRTARYSTPVIEMQFTVTAGSASSLSEERAHMTYRTRIKLRNL